MEPAVQMNIGGIKCDTPDCDFRDDTVKVEDYAQWLNKPCEKCGGNLLTEADYKNTQRIIQFVNLLNKFSPPADPSEEKAVLRMEMNGTGKVGMEIKPLED